MAYEKEKVEKKAGSKAGRNKKKKGYKSEGTKKTKTVKQGKKPTGPRNFFGKLANLFRGKSKKKRYKTRGAKRTESLKKKNSLTSTNYSKPMF